MDSLFGEGTSLPVRFFIAFVVVFALIGVTAWLIRRFGTGALGGTGARGRAPRLAVIEAGAVDGRRKLVLIRRDNTEHLLMIGGPTDIVVEANIVRGQSARETGTSRTSSATEALPRTPPAEESAWPLQPEAAPRNGRASRPAPLEDANHWALPPEPAPPAPAPAAPAKRSRSAETLAGLAAELSVRPSEPVPPAPPAPRPAPAVAEASRAKPAAAQAPAASSASADQNLADMASRLEAALRRPAAAPAPTPRPAAPPKPMADAPRVAPPMVPTPVPQVAPAVTPPAPPVAKEPAPVSAAIEPEKKKSADDTPGKSDDVFGSIEEEMANLLGRPSGKPS